MALITVDQLKRFSGVYNDEDTTTTELLNIYIGSASDVIASYVGYNPETHSDFSSGIPSIFKLVCLEIATLMQQEENSNIGINSKSFGDNGSRTFLNIVDYTKYLSRLSKYRISENLTA